MARRDDDDDDDDRPRGRRNASSSSTVILLIVLGVFGVTSFGCILVMIALLLPAVQQAREAARRTQERNNLKQIGLGAHNFHDVHNHFPPAPEKEGEVVQSWMTELLPYVDQAPVYNTINRQAPWDDASNQAAMTALVPAYLNPSLPTMKDPATGYAQAHFAGNIHIFGPGIRFPIRDMKDGTSNTMLAGSVSEGIRPWGDPANVRDPAAGIGPGPNQFLRGATKPPGCHILMADGSVRFVSGNVSPQVMQGLAKPDDGVLPGEF